MMFVQVTFESALHALGNPRCALADTVMPERIEEPAHSTYVQGYGWLFTYERALARFLSSWLEPHRWTLFGNDGIVTEALSNAFCHGNRRDARAPIEVYVYIGDHGLAIRVEDRGQGFDVDKVIARVANNQKGYFHNAGNGMQRMHESPDFAIFFDNDGRACNIVYHHQGPNALCSVADNVTDKDADSDADEEFAVQLRDSLEQAGGFEIDDIVAAALITGHGDKVMSFHFRERDALDLARYSMSIWECTQEMCRRSSAGPPSIIHVNTTTHELLLIELEDRGSCLALLLSGDANIARVRSVIPQILADMAAYGKALS
jgi:hypothetical protein